MTTPREATLPGGAPRAFNGLNGAEMRTRILQEVEKRLSEDGRFGAHLVFPVVTWRWRLEVETYPAAGVAGPKGEVAPLLVEAQGRVGVEGGPGRETTVFDAQVRPAEVRREPFPGGAAGGAVGDQRVRADAPRAADAVPSAVEARFARLEALVERALTAAGPVSGPSVWPDTATVTTTTGSHHPDVQMTTATGLPITGGAKPSPGAALAQSYGGGSSVGAVQTEEPVQRVALGLQHPPLDEGGVGAPDAVRREAGLPVPQMQVTAGGIVDLPAGSF